MTDTLIQPDDTLTLWSIIIVWATISIVLEQRYKWASRISGAIIALIGALALSNLNVIPTESSVYDAVWGFILPLAIPLLLFHVDLRQMWRESRRLLLIFLISTVGTVAGAILSFFLLREHIPYLDKIAAMMTASYTGGGVNFAAMAGKFETPGEMVSATIVADNLMMALFFVVLMAIPAMSFFRKRYQTPHQDAVERDAAAAGDDGTETVAAEYWGRKEISLKDIALSVGTAIFLLAVSTKLAEFFAGIIPTGDGDNVWLNLLTGIFGDKYLVLTTLTFVAMLLFPGYFKSIAGSQEIGTFLIYLFFMVIGIPASIPLIVQNAPLLLVFVFIIVACNLAISLGLGKLFKFDLEQILLASNANIGGPTTAAAMAIAKGWKNLVGPILVVGTVGYLIGNYLGTAVGVTFAGMM